MSLIGNGVDSSIFGDGRDGDVNCTRGARVAEDISVIPAYTGSGGPGVGYTLTANVNGALTLDGIALAVADRVLLYGYTNFTDSGIYVVNSAGSAGTPWILVRASDFDDATDNIRKGDAVAIHDGTSHGNSIRVLDIIEVEVDAASTANIGLYSVSPIDGVGLSPGSVVLLKDQTNPVENGIWIYYNSFFSRHPDYITKESLSRHPSFHIKGGAVNAGRWYYPTDVLGYQPDAQAVAFTLASQAYTVGVNGFANANSVAIDRDWYYNRFNFSLTTDGVFTVPFYQGRMFCKSGMRIAFGSADGNLQFVCGYTDGANGTVSVSGAGGTAVSGNGSIGRGSDGGTGGLPNNVGNNGTDSWIIDNSASYVYLGGRGGVGGSGAAPGAAKAGGAGAGASPIATEDPSTLISLMLAKPIVVNNGTVGLILPLNGGGGGGGGGATAVSGHGGGGGSGGGIVFVASPMIDISLNGYTFPQVHFLAKGGYGGNTVAVLSGGGGGGGGGAVVLIHGGFRCPVNGYNINVDGGQGGAGNSTYKIVLSNGDSSVKAATNAALPSWSVVGPGVIGAIANGGLVIDSYTAKTNDIVLIKDETLTPYNGIYLVVDAGGPSSTWTLQRDTSFDSPGEMSGSKYIGVFFGEVNRYTSWYLTAPVSSVDSDPAVFGSWHNDRGSWGVGGRAYNVDVQAGTVKIINGMAGGIYPGRAGDYSYGI